MDKIVVVMCRDNVQYEESEWVAHFTTQPLKEVQAKISAINDELFDMHREASDFYYAKMHADEDFMKDFEDTAPGKRYMKKLRDLGLIKRGDKYVSTSCALSLYAIEVDRKSL